MFPVNVNQIKSEIESRLCSISSEALDICVCSTTIIKIHVLSTWAHEWNIVDGDQNTRRYLQFVGTFRRVEFQVEIVDLLDLLFVEKL